MIDALQMALWTRKQQRRPITDELIYHSDAGSQYTSTGFTSELKNVGITPSIGSIGDAYDNALAETTIGI